LAAGQSIWSLNDNGYRPQAINIDFWLHSLKSYLNVVKVFGIKP
jgi:hypothetical protein